MYKVLLDENLPVRIKYRLQDICEIYTVNDKGWNALENGDLIDARELCILAHSLYKNAISISPAIFIFNAVFVWAEGCI